MSSKFEFEAKHKNKAPQRYLSIALSAPLNQHISKMVRNSIKVENICDLYFHNLKQFPKDLCQHQTKGKLITKSE